MKRKKSTARWMGNLLTVGLIVFGCITAARARVPPNGTVIPRVCIVTDGTAKINKR